MGQRTLGDQDASGITLFARGGGDSLYVKTFTTGWSAWSPLGGVPRLRARRPLRPRNHDPTTRGDSGSPGFGGECVCAGV